MNDSFGGIEKLEADFWEPAEIPANPRLRAARDLLLPRLISGEIAV